MSRDASDDSRRTHAMCRRVHRFNAGRKRRRASSNGIVADQIDSETAVVESRWARCDTRANVEQLFSTFNCRREPSRSIARTSECNSARPVSSFAGQRARRRARASLDATGRSLVALADLCRTDASRRRRRTRSSANGEDARLLVAGQRILSRGRATPLAHQVNPTESLDE
jgi:hypothetical protein